MKRFMQPQYFTAVGGVLGLGVGMTSLMVAMLVPHMVPLFALAIPSLSVGITCTVHALS